MLAQHTGLTIRDLANFLKKEPQTIRLHLKKAGLLNPRLKSGKEYIINEDAARQFIANDYPVHYNEFVDRYAFETSEKGPHMFPIPEGNGVISNVLQRSGKRYYYVRNLPLYTDENGKVIKYNSKGFLSKDEAEQDRQQKIINRKNGVYKMEYINQLAEAKITSPQSSPAMDESYYNFCIRFFSEGEYAEATRELYIAITEQRIKPFFGDTKIKDLTKARLQEFVNQYSTNIRKMFIVLRQTLLKLYSLDLIPTFYYDSLIKPKSTAPLHPKEALSQEEVSTLLNYLKGHHIEYAVTLLFQTGLRIGELQALQWSEVEFLDDMHGRIHVNASWGKTSKGMARKAPKTRSSKRVVPFTSSYLVQLLKEAKLQAKTNWVLENKTGTGPIEKNNFTTRYFKEVGKAVGITKPMSSHVARHTYISHLIKQNVPYTTIAKLVGHDTTDMIIKVYAHAVSDEKQEFKYVDSIYSKQD